ncbi:hypothetical protein [Emticicia fontis]
MAVLPRRNGSSNEVTNNYNSTVVDAMGLPILPIVKTFGARGVTPKWGYDKNGAIVEMGWSAKIDLYKKINDSTVATSIRVESIDKRVIALMSDAQTYMLAYQSYADAQKEIDELYAMIPVIFSLGLSETKAPTGLFAIIPGVFAQSVKLLAKTQKPEDYKVIMQQLRKKLIYFETEVKSLQVLKSNLTGEYAKFDKVLSDNERSANTDTNTWVLVGVVILIVYLIIKKRSSR